MSTYDSAYSHNFRVESLILSYSGFDALLQSVDQRHERLGRFYIGVLSAGQFDHFHRLGPFLAPGDENLQGLDLERFEPGRLPGRFFGYTLRTPLWRYTQWADGKLGRELYDHDADPRELVNLADDPARADTLARLERQLREAVKNTYPKSGQTPPLRPGVWAPNLTHP